MVTEAQGYLLAPIPMASPGQDRALGLAPVTQDIHSKHGCLELIQRNKRSCGQGRCHEDHSPKAPVATREQGTKSLTSQPEGLSMALYPLHFPVSVFPAWARWLSIPSNSDHAASTTQQWTNDEPKAKASDYYDLCQ